MSDDDPYAISPHIKAISDLLPALCRLTVVCAGAGFVAESMLAGGLSLLLAEWVAGDTPPHSPEHAVAQSVLRAGNGPDAAEAADGNH